MSTSFFRHLIGPGRGAGLTRGTLVLVLVLALLLAGAGSTPYVKDVLTMLLIYVAGATAWNLVGGMAGQFSLAHSAFLGIGAYATVMLLKDTGTPWPIALVLAGAASGIFAVIAGGLLVRQRAAYFTVGSMALTLLTLSWFTIWEVSGASRGISAPVSATPDRNELYLVAVGVAVFAIACALAIYYSGYGLRLMSVRDDEDVADSLGLSPAAVKLQALAVSGVLTGIAGALFALKNATIEPFSAFSLDWTLSFIVIAIVGGLGTVWGPVIGAVVIYYGLTVQLRDYPALSQIVSAVLAIAIIKLFPTGIVGAFSALERARRHRRALRTSVSTPPTSQTDGPSERETR